MGSPGEVALQLHAGLQRERQEHWPSVQASGRDSRVAGSIRGACDELVPPRRIERGDDSRAKLVESPLGREGAPNTRVGRSVVDPTRPNTGRRIYDHRTNQLGVIRI